MLRYQVNAVSSSLMIFIGLCIFEITIRFQKLRNILYSVVTSTNGSDSFKVHTNVTGAKKATLKSSGAMSYVNLREKPRQEVGR